MQALDNLITALQLKLPTATEQERKMYHQLREARNTMPEALLHDVVARISAMLPQVEQRHGTQSPTYLFYLDLILVCFWAHRYQDITTQAATKISNQKLEITVLREQLSAAEKRLALYETADELIMSGTIDAVVKAQCQQVLGVLPNHPRATAFLTALNKISETYAPAT